MNRTAIWTPDSVVTIGDGSNIVFRMGKDLIVARGVRVTEWEIKLPFRDDIPSLGDSMKRFAMHSYAEIMLRLTAIGIDKAEGDQLVPMDLERYSVLGLLREINGRLAKRD